MKRAIYQFSIEFMESVLKGIGPHMPQDLQILSIDTFQGSRTVSFYVTSNSFRDIAEGTYAEKVDIKTTQQAAEEVVEILTNEPKRRKKL